MAVIGLHLKHFKKKDAVAIFKHNFRVCDCKTNVINTEKSQYNIALVDPCEKDFISTLRPYLRDAENNGQRFRKDLNVFSEIVVTCPSEYQGDAQKFLIWVSMYLLDKIPFPCMSAVIHYDEMGLPHLHYDVIPFSDGKFCASKIFTKGFLKSIHDEIPAYMRERGYDIERAKGEQTRSRGSLTYHEYKIQKDEAEKSLDDLKSKKRELVSDYNLLVGEYNDLLRKIEKKKKCIQREEYAPCR